jgi:predicted dehydrogenase
MERGNWSRRGFLACMLGGLAAAGIPAWFARDTLARALGIKRRSVGANERIVMGAIGVGTNRTRRTGDTPIQGARGIAVMKKAMHESGVQMIAVCDVDCLNAQFAQQQVQTARHGGVSECRVFDDFRRLLEDRDINAVTIGTPDHWHALIAIAAMRAGKDVYCEKPMTLTIEEGKAVARVARETGRIFQVGTQQRTEFDGRFRLATELVRIGRIGRVRRITTLIGGNMPGGPFQPQPVPVELDWTFWRGPLADADYFPQRCHYDFRWWYEASGGRMTDWGAHHNDIAQWMLGMDDSGPIRIVATGTAPPHQSNCFDCHPTFEVTYTYGNAARTELICRSLPPANWPIRETVHGTERAAENGILLEGEDNRWLWVSRDSIQASDRRLIDAPPPRGCRAASPGRQPHGQFPRKCSDA